MKSNCLRQTRTLRSRARLFNGRFGAFGDPDRPAVDQAEVDWVAADPGEEFPAAGPVRGHQQDIVSRQEAGHVCMDSLVHGLVGPDDR
jgi:hypothetical protein